MGCVSNLQFIFNKNWDVLNWWRHTHIFLKSSESGNRAQLCYYFHFNWLGSRGGRVGPPGPNLPKGPS
jgi:hypothetical protein